MSGSSQKHSCYSPMTAKRFVQEANDALKRGSTTSSAITTAIAKARVAITFIENHRDNKLLKDFKIPDGLVNKLEARRRRLVAEEEALAEVQGRGHVRRPNRY